eukprot:SAG22_NODE_8_length_37215_cov_120.960351_28_plen_159_part_00
MHPLSKCSRSASWTAHTGSFFHAQKGLELPRGYDEATGRPLWVADQDDLPSVAMPNCVRCAVPAGSMVVFDTCIWHVAVPNTSQRDRVGTICGFGGGSETPMGIPPADLAVLEADGTLSPNRKAAFGLPLGPEEELALAPAREAARRYVIRRTGGNAN